MSLWELVAYVDGRNEGLEGDKVEAMSNDEFEQLKALHKVH